MVWFLKSHLIFRYLLTYSWVSKRTCTFINFDKNFPKFQVPNTFVSDDKYLSLTFEVY